jgi:hypothetical protein
MNEPSSYLNSQKAIIHTSSSLITEPLVPAMRNLMPVGDMFLINSGYLQIDYAESDFTRVTTAPNDILQLDKDFESQRSKDLTSFLNSASIGVLAQLFGDQCRMALSSASNEFLGESWKSFFLKGASNLIQTKVNLPIWRDSYLRLCEQIKSQFKDYAYYMCEVLAKTLNFLSVDGDLVNPYAKPTSIAVFDLSL